MLRAPTVAVALAVVSALGAGAILAGCQATAGRRLPPPVSEAGLAPPTAPPTSTRQVGSVTLEGAPHAAWARREVDLFKKPAAGTRMSSYPAHTPWGGPSVFLVRDAWRDELGDLWLRVQLPRRPNGASAWARARDLALTPLQYAVEVDLSERRLRLLRDGDLVKTYRVAVGRATTPTPVGDFYVTVKLRPPVISRVYGDWALGLSGFSDVLDQFGTGDGQIAVHGTSGTWSLGQAVSNGCVRMSNRDISELARLLPQGSPVRIKA